MQFDLVDVLFGLVRFEGVQNGGILFTFVPAKERQKINSVFSNDFFFQWLVKAMEKRIN